MAGGAEGRPCRSASSRAQLSLNLALSHSWYRSARRSRDLCRFSVSFFRRGRARCRAFGYSRWGADWWWAVDCHQSFRLFFSLGGSRRGHWRGGRRRSRQRRCVFVSLALVLLRWQRRCRAWTGGSRWWDVLSLIIFALVLGRGRSGRGRNRRTCCRHRRRRGRGSCRRGGRAPAGLCVVSAFSFGFDRWRRNILGILALHLRLQILLRFGSETEVQPCSIVGFWIFSFTILGATGFGGFWKTCGAATTSVSPAPS